MTTSDYPAAEYYDLVWGFVADEVETEKQLNFIKQQIPLPATIMDVGVGTGRHAIPLLKLGYNVVGVDNSEGMLKKFREKLEVENLKAEIVETNVHELSGLDERYDGAICFWNAITDMAKDMQELENVLRRVKNTLKTGSKFIIEQNIDLEDFKIESLEFDSTIEHEGCTYRSIYTVVDWDPNTYLTTCEEHITITKNGELVHETHDRFTQKWWTRTELQKAAKNVGFKEAQFFGGEFLPLSENHENLITVLTK